MSLPFIIIYTIWLLTEVLLNRLLHSKNTDKQNADNNSLRFIWITIFASVSVAVYIAGRFYVPIFSNPFYAYVGLAIICFGVILRFIAIYSLGKFFTVDVTIRQEHKLKKDGLYKYLRHPSYFASYISFVGFGLSLNNWISLVIVALAILIAFTRRIQVEEKVLVAHFGDEYLQYRQSTKALIPFVY